jgi:hypothetical protein
MISQDSGLSNETVCGGTPDDLPNDPCTCCGDYGHVLDINGRCLKCAMIAAEVKAPEPAVARGFVGLICPSCASGDEVITVDLHDLDTFRCQGCENEFTAEQVREFLAAAEGWRVVLAWIEQAPVIESVHN